MEERGAAAQGTARLAWHLGNRHLPVRVFGDGGIRFRHDCVIEAMARILGGRIECQRAPFTPETEAYEHHVGPYDHGDD